MGDLFCGELYSVLGSRVDRAHLFGVLGKRHEAEGLATGVYLKLVLDR